MKRKRVVVALSGGVDSSVAAALAKEENYEVIGVTLRMKHPDPEFSAAQLCASKNDEAAVEQVCRTLNIEHHYLEKFPDFEQRVLRHAAAEYGCGRTPNPCCDCNLLVKFGSMIEFAEQCGAEAVLTGHYAKLKTAQDGSVQLWRGDDLRKDQSYFLYRLTQRELGRIRFPVGGMEKSEVRRLAAAYGFITSEKPDSQDACFQVPGECFGETLRRLCALPRRPGFFRYQGRIVGRHEGIHHYTIGQRKGLRVALGVPAYISGIDANSGDIELATDPDLLLSRRFTVRGVTWQSGQPPRDTEELAVQVRYRSRAVRCRLTALEGGTAVVEPLEPQRAVTPGQAAVFYLGAQLLGGGVIDDVD